MARMISIAVALALFCAAALPARADESPPAQPAAPVAQTKDNPAKPASTKSEAMKPDSGDPLDKPGMNDLAVKAWVASSAARVMTFRAADYQKHAAEVSHLFTPGGWKRFSEDFEQSLLFGSIMGLKQTATAEAKTPPVIVDERADKGTYKWLLSMPLTVRCRFGNLIRTDTLQLNLGVERVAKGPDNPAGLGFSQWITELPPP